MSKFKKATKKNAKLRMMLYGPTGSGKTFTALRMATGIGGKIALIDSERGRASKYADLFEFDVCEPVDNKIKSYEECIDDAADDKFPILIVDSLSHPWEELKIKVEQMAQSHFGGNTWAAWSKGTPEQVRFIDRIVTYPGHVICTMRAKTSWIQQDNGRGGKTYKRVGSAPIQRSGVEYEFDLMASIDIDHNATIEKDNSNQFQDDIINKPGEKFGRAMAAWLEEGETDPDFDKKRLGQRITAEKAGRLEMGCDPAAVDLAMAGVKGKTLETVTVPELEVALVALEALTPEVGKSRAETAASVTAPLPEGEPADFHSA